MSFESNFTGSENNGSSSSSYSAAATAEHPNTLQAQIEAEKRAKIEELLAPYRVKRGELQAKRDELARGLAEVDKALEELDGVISSTEASVGLQPSHPPKRHKKKAHKKSAAGASTAKREPVDQEWVTGKLRERHLSSAELTKLAKQEKFKPASVRAVLAKMTDENLVRIADGEHYELVQAEGGSLRVV